MVRNCSSAALVAPAKSPRHSLGFVPVAALSFGVHTQSTKIGHNRSRSHWLEPRLEVFPQESMMRKVLCCLLAMLMLLAGSQAAPINGSYVAEVTGASTGPSPFVAVVTTQTRAIAYICDGEQIAEWFRADLQAGGLFEARSTTKKSGITAQVNAGSVVGAITLETGKVISFRAIPADGTAGLYRSDDSIDNQRFVGGWVVLPNGDQRGAVIGGSSTRPGRKLEIRSGFVGVNLPDLGLLQPFQVTPNFLMAP
jgi:hypothetical protein